MPPWITSPIQPVCGFFFLHNNERCWLPLAKLSSHTSIVASAAHTTLTQTFVMPSEHGHPKPPATIRCAKLSPFCKGIPEKVPEIRYAFPLYDGVSVVAFSCKINDDRTITGVVKERAEAKAKFDEAVAKGQTAGLLEQDLSAGDVFTTTVGNVPAGATVVVEISYIGELKHDAEVDGLRFTIPTRIAPRYGDHGHVAGTIEGGESIEIVVDAEMPASSAIKAIKSPSHPVAVSIGSTSTTADQQPVLSRASATLALNKADLDKDFVLQVVADKLGDPSAVVESHPTLKTKALMATLVPKFNLPPADLPEVVFVCDRSGSMTDQIKDLVVALRIFLKSLPVGIRFNICSFGSSHDFLFDRSEVYSKQSLDKAMAHVDKFSANYGGTEMYKPIEDVFKRRYHDLPLEVFVLTDGEIWAQDELFGLINKTVTDAKGAIRLFSLGVGSGASTSLVEGIARAGNGFAQMVADGEAMDRKVVRMLKGALTAHVTDYRLEVKWAKDHETSTPDDDGFEFVEKVEDFLKIDPTKNKDGDGKKETISLFDTSTDPDGPIPPARPSPVPAVSLPEIIQAPHTIPPLFPFHRTSVYLLLTGASARKTPVAVILRGTSPHGPLELEIPVSDNGSGKTISQLAARKAVQELEQGRGWLYHARELHSDQLVKDKYDAKFKDLVKHEAVRLGVAYGVGGKWCSFVALEGSDETEADVMSQGDSIAAPAGGLRSFGGAMPMGRMAAPVSKAYKMQAAPAAFAAPEILRGGSPGFFSAPVASQALFGSAPSAPPPPPSVSATFIPPPLGGAVFGAAPATVRSRSRSKPSADDAENLIDYSDEDYSDAAAPRTALDKVIGLQDFDGAWEWSSELAAALGVDEAAVANIAGGSPKDSQFVATCVVLVWLGSVQKDSRESWEMVADKATAWARQKGDVDEMRAKLGGLWAA